MDRYAEHAAQLSRDELEAEYVEQRRRLTEAELVLRHLGHPDWRRTAWPQVRLRHFHGEFQPKR